MCTGVDPWHGRGWHARGVDGGDVDGCGVRSTAGPTQRARGRRAQHGWADGVQKLLRVAGMHDVVWHVTGAGACRVVLDWPLQHTLLAIHEIQTQLEATTLLCSMYNHPQPFRLGLQQVRAVRAPTDGADGACHMGRLASLSGASAGKQAFAMQHCWPGGSGLECVLLRVNGSRANSVFTALPRNMPSRAHQKCTTQRGSAGTVMLTSARTSWALMARRGLSPRAPVLPMTSHGAR